MSTLHLVLIAGMASWIVSLPAVALFRWLAGSTRPRDVEIDDEAILRRLRDWADKQPAQHEMEWI